MLYINGLIIKIELLLFYFFVVMVIIIEFCLMELDINL